MCKLRVLYVLLLLNGCTLSAQDSLKSKTAIDLRSTALWENLSAEGNFLPEYAYLDSLDFYQITYEVDDHAVMGYIIEPQGEGPYPALIFNRGGNRTFGELDLKMMVYTTAYLAAEGKVILASNYRDEDEFGGEEINDVLFLLDYCQGWDKVNEDHLGMIGHSRGGMMSYLAMAKTNQLKKVAIINGSTDQFSCIEERPGMEGEVYAQCIPNYWENKDEELRARSAIYWPKALHRETELLILAGTKDWRVSSTQAEQLGVKLEAIGHPFELRLIDTDHGFSNRRPQLKEILAEYFDDL